MSSRSSEPGPLPILDESRILFPDVRVNDEGAWRHVADRHLRHEFDVLGSGWVRVHYGMQCQGFEGENYSDLTVTAESVLQQLAPARRGRSAELLRLARQFAPEYVPIDWHIDFKSGYRYPLVHHKQLKYGLVRGLDAKVSADLSRCYHFVTLALAWWATGEERYRREMLAQILDWMAFNPFEYGPAWRANMNVSIRVVNWIVAFSIIRDSFQVELDLDRAFLEAFQASLIRHRRFIAENLEFPDEIFHPNHYVANLAGLLVVCSFCRGWDPDAAAWHNLALRELRVELDRQVLADGFDFEAATSYHALVLEMVSYGLILAARVEGNHEPPAVRAWIGNHLGAGRLARLRAMFVALRDIIQPNGLIPLVGDTDDGRFLYLETPQGAKRDWRFLSGAGAALFEDPTLLPHTVVPQDGSAAGLLLHGGRLEGRPIESKSTAYPDVGFYIMRGAGLHSLISCGAIGTGGKGGHCHNDKLSLTLCVDNVEVIVDPGVYVYTASKEYRDLYRSVSAHSTVAVDGEEQNRFLSESPWWGCHEDTCCRCIKWESSSARDVFVGEHRGYLRLEPPVLHRRRVVWQKAERSVTITDELVIEDLAEPGPEARVTFMLHPRCEVPIVDGRLAVVEREGVHLEFATSGGRWQLDSGLYAPSYGIQVPCPKLTLSLAGGVSENTVVISF